MSRGSIESAYLYGDVAGWAGAQWFLRFVIALQMKGLAGTRTKGLAEKCSNFDVGLDDTLHGALAQRYKIKHHCCKDDGQLQSPDSSGLDFWH